jgi:ADP-ribosylation factor protein 6
VVDSTDRLKIDEARDELSKILDDDQMKSTILLIFANKNDVVDAMTAADVTEKLQLNKLKDKSWHVQSCCALSGEGLLDGLTWLNAYVK